MAMNITKERLFKLSLPLALAAIQADMSSNKGMAMNFRLGNTRGYNVVLTLANDWDDPMNVTYRYGSRVVAKNIFRTAREAIKNVVENYDWFSKGPVQNKTLTVNFCPITGQA